MTDAARSAVRGAEPTDLLGDWALARRLNDRRARQHGTVRGVLRLRRAGEDVEWAENGTLSWQGSDIAVFRHYLLRRGDGGWWVLFPDGRPFHPWRPGSWVEHPCAADTYRGLVTVDSSLRWRTLWDVDGPEKSQRIVTRLARSPAPC